MNNIYFNRDNSERLLPLTPDRKDDLFFTICEDLCKYRAMFDEPDDDDLADNFCCVCPVKQYL